MASTEAGSDTVVVAAANDTDYSAPAAARRGARSWPTSSAAAFSPDTVAVHMFDDERNTPASWIRDVIAAWRAWN
jgi:hypothetical protein